MNVLSDFKIRLNSFVPENETENEIAALNKIIDEKEKKIIKMEADIQRLTKRKKRKSVSGKK
jgi:alpha-amylase